jgi:integrase
MPVRNKPLTQRIIDAAPLPKTGFKELRESGLVLRLYATGRKAWSFEYASPVTRKKARISFEATSLADARAIVQRHRVAIDEGKDPNLARKDTVAQARVEHARAIIVRDSLDKYEPGFLADAPLKQASRRDRMHRLRRVLSPLMERAVSSLTQSEMVLFLDEVQETSGPIARNRAHAEIRAWLGWAKRREHAPTNVLDRVPKEVSETSRKRSRVLTDAELAAMMSATADGAAFSDYVRVLLHTAMRRDEGASMQPRWLDFEARTITVPPTVSKTARERVLPMADAIAPMLASRANGLAREGYIFGEATLFRSPFQGWHKPTERLRAAMPPCGDDGWTLHDIRRTVATRMHKAKVHPLVIEDLLGHLGGVRGGVAGVYNQAETLEDQRLAVADWAAQMASPTNVIALKRVA